MCKYGDFYLYLEIAEKFGVYNVTPLSVYDMIREEGSDPTNPSYVCFKIDPIVVASGGVSSRIKDKDGKIKFENYEIAHFRLLTDANYLPYGRSYIEPARKTYKQYVLMKDAMLLHRITRAPEKRVYYVDIGNMPPAEVDGYMERLKQKMQKTPFVDKQTGEYNLKYNMMNVMEDFYIPQRGSNSNTRIDTLKGLEYNAIEDINFLRDEMLSALKVPKAFFGFEKDLCISPDTKIPLLDGRNLTAGEIITEYNEGKKNYVYSLDELTNNIVPGEIEWAGFTRMNTQTVKVWLDNNEYIQCTPDHLFLTRKGEWKEAQYLTRDETLMPLYLNKCKNKQTPGYTQVYHPSTGKYELVHRLVANYYGIKKEKKVIHHLDFNKSNNNPENLDCSMDFWEHSKYHAQHNQNTLQKWIKENGASRKGHRNIHIVKCKGCGVDVNTTKIKPSQKHNYCSVECKQNNWKTKYKNINFDLIIEAANGVKNFNELRKNINIKDSTTFKKILEFNNISKEDFIIKYMKNAHNNFRFMSQFPKTNQYYINNFNPSRQEHKEKYNYKNHKVDRIEWVEENIDTCDLTIKKYHNFGTMAGVIIHNSGKATLAAEDIRFARTVERIQRIILSELYKIALIHLYIQGYDGESLSNFELNLSTPSVVYEQEKVALWKEKIGLAKDIMESKLMPSDWIYDYVFNFSEDQYDEMRDLVMEDMKRNFRLGQIENEGNDPAKSGKSYGTPHDLATLYGAGRYTSKKDQVPPGYNETNPVGRPQERTSIINTQKDPLGKDRLGRKDNKANDNSDENTFYKTGTLALAESFKLKETLNKIPINTKKIIDFESREQDSSLLDEKNIKNI